jgi:hypothetical protein
MTELARPLEVTLSSLQQELESLSPLGFSCSTETVGAFILTQTPNPPLFPELRGLVEKTSGTILELKAAIFPAGFMSGT